MWRGSCEFPETRPLEDDRQSRLTYVRNSIHNLGLVGHIEDIAVAKDQQGKKLGLRIIQALDYIGQKVGCYKVSTFPLLPFVLFPQLTLRLDPVHP